MLPLLTFQVHERLLAAARTGETIVCSLDLERSQSTVAAAPEAWSWNGHRYPYIERCKERTVYYWTGAAFEPAARFDRSLIKLVPTNWGPPTFEIDGIKMLPTAQISPYEDARRKVAWVQPRDKVILDTCGGLGYFAACCLEGSAREVISYEKNADVIWLRGLNPWSPSSDARLSLTQADITQCIAAHTTASMDAVLHDPPRFGIAGELYSQAFYDELARVLKRKGRLFHYTGTPNKLSSGRDVPLEVAKRLQNAGFTTEIKGDGVLAIRR